MKKLEKPVRIENFEVNLSERSQDMLIHHDYLNKHDFLCVTLSCKTFRHLLKIS